MFLKHVNPSGLNKDQLAALNIVFPVYSKEEMEARQQYNYDKLRHEVDQHLGIKLSLDLEPKAEFEFSQILTRRYSGGDSLPRNRYYTLARNENGDDQATLKQELYAYFRPEKVAMFLMWDTTLTPDIEELRSVFGVDAGTQHIVLGFPNQSRETLNNLGLNITDIHDEIGGTIEIPVSMKRESIDNVIDLRLPDVADWFADYFSREIIHLLKPPLESFEEILPTLLYQQIGGGSFSELVGRELRKMGANGFIYPSVRSNAYVEIRGGVLHDFGGWNFVDYRDLETLDHNMIMDSEPEWSPFVDSFIRGQIVYHKAILIEFDSTEPNKGSWKTEGLKETNKALKEIRMIEGFLLQNIRHFGLHAKTIMDWLIGLFIADSVSTYQLAFYFNNIVNMHDRPSMEMIRSKMKMIGHAYGIQVFLAIDAVLQFVERKLQDTEPG